MGALSKGTGFFRLNDSDNYVGSLFTVEDIYKILEIDKSDVEEFRDALLSLKLLKEEDVVDEGDLYKHFKDIKGLYSSVPLPSKASFDECILKQIFIKALAGAKISQQIGFRDPKTKRTKYVDFKIEFEGQTKYIEFDGPTHFYDRFKESLYNPIDRKHQVEDILGNECILWPFWIQRCERNVKAIFDKSINGYGALWSTNVLFQSFNIPNPAKVIIEEIKQFRAEREKGIGYFYGGDTENRHIPEHPIIGKILKGKKSIDEIIPKGVSKDKKYWIPEKLWHLI